MFDFLSPAWIQDLIQTYGLWVMFAIIMFESMGLPLPGETVLVTAALYSGTRHQISILMVVSVAAFAAIIGDNLGYLIGRSIGFRFLVRYGHYIGLHERRLRDAASQWGGIRSQVWSWSILFSLCVHTFLFQGFCCTGRSWAAAKAWNVYRTLDGPCPLYIAAFEAISTICGGR